MIRWLTGLGLLLMSGSLYAQNCSCTLRGEVNDRQTGQPVAGAVIWLPQAKRQTQTNAAGRYELRNLCQGKHQLVCQVLGYQSDTLSIELRHEELEQDLHLREEDVHLQNVTVTAQRLESSLLTRSTIEGIVLDQTRGQTLADALKNVTGVTTLQTGSSIGKPIIHGMHSNRVLILNNGIRQEGQQWGSEHAPEIDPFVAKRLTVVKGAAGVRYGPEALAGVVLVEPEPLPQQPDFQGELNLVGFSNGRQGVGSLQLQGGLGIVPGLAWRVQGTLKRGGNIRTPGYFLDNTGISERNYSITLGYRRGNWQLEGFMTQFSTELGIFSGSHIGSVSDLENVLKNGEPFIKSGFSYQINRPFQDVSHTLQKLKISYAPAQRGVWNLTLARQINERAEYDLHRPRNDSLANLNRPELNFKLTSFTADLVWEHPAIARKITGSAGLSLSYQRNLVYGRPLIPNFRQATAGLFWLEKYTHQDWELEAGVRYDFRYQRITLFPSRGVRTYEHLQFGNASGSLGVLRRLGSHWSMRLNGGMAWRPPNVNELYSAGVHHGAAAYEEGDATLNPETAFNLDYTAEYTGKRLRAEVSVYRNYMQNFIYLKPQSEPILTIRGAFPYFKYTQVNAVFQGIDASFTYLITKPLSWQTKYAVVRAKDVEHEARLVQIPPDRLENSLRWQPEKAVLGLTNFFVEAGHSYVAKQIRAPENGDFAPPPAAYWLWNAAIGGSIPIHHHPLQLSLSVSNAFNTRYRDYLNRFRYYADDQGRNLSLRAKWIF
ncbi:TonB-dependent receptor [Siphonobacter sp. BAB-5405]|uniref:TonB-dependent receptor n=1 Tax=Siphonobacter sp. BAB-5405 TaxID=1864825 RepID=UPI000C802C75|nr:TonB-dependent receptor [Siphonobacter sp. BAB-5405]PMD94370.1 TonB-dependent receptor [Siphonobacter sp. BAB-5405]